MSFDRPEVSTTIDGVEYRATLMGGETALEMCFQLGKLLGPALDKLGPAFAHKGDLASIPAEAIAPALGAILASMPGQARAFIREGLWRETYALAPSLSGPGKQKYELSQAAHVEALFAGKLGAYIKVAAWSVKVHLGSFLEGLGGVGPLLGAVIAKATR